MHSWFLPNCVLCVFCVTMWVRVYNISCFLCDNVEVYYISCMCFFVSVFHKFNVIMDMSVYLHVEVCVYINMQEWEIFHAYSHACTYWSAKNYRTYRWICLTLKNNNKTHNSSVICWTLNVPFETVFSHSCLISYWYIHDGRKAISIIC